MSFYLVMVVMKYESVPIEMFATKEEAVEYAKCKCIWPWEVWKFWDGSPSLVTTSAIPAAEGEIAALVEVATNDPEGATLEGMEAGERLEELAWAAGFGRGVRAEVTDWADVGQLALGISIPYEAAAAR